MARLNRVYRLVGILNVAVHTALVVFVAVVGFLPFYEGKNVYQSLGAASFFSLFLLVAAGAMAVLAVKRPWCSFGSLLLTAVFAVVMVFPYMTEAMIVGFASPWVDVSMSSWEQGFVWMTDALVVLYWDVAFLIFAIAVGVCRFVKKHQSIKR